MIELDDVFVLYRGAEHDVVALRGLSLKVAAGERVVVNGPSGSGKSTLIKVVTADVLPGAGRAVVLGRDLGQLGAAASRLLRRERIGIITQGSGRDLAPELTCVENVALQARLAGVPTATAMADAHAALERCRVGHLADRWPESLSGGEAQRVGVASALASKPGVIVADEPTGELDRVNADVVYDLLAEQAAESGAGLLVVTHDVKANRIADRVVTIRDGRVSSELRDQTSLLIVDERGWVRIPEEDRHFAGITDRATTRPFSEGLVLSGTAPVAMAVGKDQPEVGATAAAGTLLLSARDVSMVINGVTVLAPTTLTLSTGQLTVLSGPSGSGKTTLLGLLGGLGKPSEGTIEQVAAHTTSIGSSLAGFAEQVSVTENLQLARQVRGLPHADVLWALAELGVERLADRPVGMLSGGERQRVGIARALITDAEVVLLDEPTSQLDEASAARVASILQRLAQEGRAIVCASHDPALVAVADNLVSLGALTLSV
jgi:ABC-type lipoprotein export system ATPase subunit